MTLASTGSCLNSDTKGQTLFVQGKTMITVLCKKLNPISQKSYDRLVNSIHLFNVQCTCGAKGCLIRFGHYRRHVKLFSSLISLVIQRVWCKQCRTSHAILPSGLVPYSQISLEDQQQILICVEKGEAPEPVMDNNFLIDENNVKYIIRQFRRHWKQRILSIGKTLQDCLTEPCLLTYSRQFIASGRFLFVPGLSI